MILTGGGAARLTGCLPGWRSGPAQDIDLIGSREEFYDLVAWFRARYPVVVPVERDTRRWTIFAVADRPGDHVFIDFALDEKPASQAVMALTDHTTVEIFGQSVWVISELTQLVIKLAYVDFPVRRENNDRDIAFWSERVGDDEWSGGHHAAFEAIKAEYAAQFA